MTNPEEMDVMPGSDGWAQGAKQMLGLCDAPAYLRRARRVEESIERVARRCESKRYELLDGVRFRLRGWNRLCQDDGTNWERLPEEMRRLLEIVSSTAFSEGDRRIAFGVTGTVRDLLEAINESVERFNRRWLTFVESLDTTAANRLIDGYNQYYLFEKECAVGSPWLAARGYQPKEVLNRDWILKRYPPLPTLGSLASPLA
ncbi:hypothetical protein Pan216_57160 [Planctomycetes bacterium Pan216]|uniref:Uncharacterized protein n=1 Tax=Kolteria novifilia TaxID=2527975 RepID=A0A518BD48_9BACT|nr:hypothetical protein Pan216_57160 [Planctomycetes bacterium Pan216]